MPNTKSASVSSKTSVAKRAVTKAKTAPQKIMVHTLTTALDTIEKAAVIGKVSNTCTFRLLYL